MLTKALPTCYKARALHAIAEGQMRVELLDSSSGFPLTSRAWNALVGAAVTNTIFQTREWLDTWWKSFGQESQLWFLAVHEGDPLVGFAPLMLHARPGGHRELQFAAGPHSDYLDFVLPDTRKDALCDIARLLYARRAEWDSFYLRNLPMRSPTYSHIASMMRDARLLCFEESVVPCPVLELASREAETRALLDKYSIKRPYTRLRKTGNVLYRRIRERSEIAACLPMFFQQHIDRWHGTDHPSPFREERHRAWFTSLAEVLAERGWLHFSVLELDGRPIAAHFGFQYEGKLIWYKPSFDPAFAHWSPGVVLVRYLIEDALNEGCSEVDFTIGGELFKSRFANAERLNVNLRIFHQRHRYAAAVTEKAMRTTAKRVLNLAKWLATGAIL